MKNTNPTYEINGHTYEAYKAPRVWPYRLKCAATGKDFGFISAEKRNDFIQVWRSLSETVNAMEAK